MCRALYLMALRTCVDCAQHRVKSQSHTFTASHLECQFLEHACGSKKEHIDI